MFSQEENIFIVVFCSGNGYFLALGASYITLVAFLNFYDSLQDLSAHYVLF